MKAIMGSAAIQSSVLFDRAADTRTEKNIIKYINHVSVSKNKPTSLLGKLGLKKELQYDPIALAKLKDLRDHLSKYSNHDSKRLNAAINRMMFQIPIGSINNFSRLERSAPKPDISVAREILAPREEVIFINSNAKLETRFNFLYQSETYKKINSFEEKRALMSKNNIIVHQDKDTLIVEPKINLLVNTEIRTASNTHHYNVIIRQAYNFASDCQLSIDDTIDQMYRALRHNRVETENLDIRFEVKESDKTSKPKNNARMSYNSYESAFVVTKQMDAKIVLGDENYQPTDMHENSIYGDSEPPAYDDIQREEGIYAKINKIVPQERSFA
ncbi:hypothetical protein [Rouxiella sp. WC2420]|uniref:Uncharacterized protein n=1 Tax=Rouxiella sp. WC2420 TaxID=3234145 RepID=A0AB39VTN0_9GAMM